MFNSSQPMKVTESDVIQETAVLDHGSSSAKETLIFYAYHHTDNALINGRFFLDHGLHDSADFIFILNGEAPEFSNMIPIKDNIRKFQRDNTCMDMGSYGEIIQANNLLSKRYKKFIFLNASIRGPFLPTWSDSCWSTIFTRTITDGMKVSISKPVRRILLTTCSFKA